MNIFKKKKHFTKCILFMKKHYYICKLCKIVYISKHYIRTSFVIIN